MRHGTIVWVEISVRDLRRAADFYSGLFGWPFEPDEANHRWIFAPPGRGAMGAVTTARSPGAGGVKIAVAVDDVDVAVRRAIELGGGVTGEAVNPTVGKARDVVDPDGNHIWLYQHHVTTSTGHDARLEGSP
jgi:predicted enzyme related to lactoylglutathione lyase